MKHEKNHPFMRETETKRRRSNSAGDLPAEFDRHLVTLDEKLSRDADSQPVPMGLADRVFRASASLLPVRSERTARIERGPLRLPRQVRTPVWGQLAMAASVAAAFMVAAWFHSASITSPAPDHGIVHHTTPVAPVAEEIVREVQRDLAVPRDAAPQPELLSSDALRLLFAGAGDYLLDTRDLTHAEAVNDLYLLYERLSEL